MTIILTSTSMIFNLHTVHTTYLLYMYMFLNKNVLLAGDSVARESDDGCDEYEEEHDGAEHD